MNEFNEKSTEQQSIDYYNQVLNAERNKKSARARKTKAKSFASEKIDFKDYIYIPQEWEGLAYAFYIFFIPYIVGNIFLFLTIARGNIESYTMLDTSAFLIVWAIGYEVTAILMLIWITIMFLQYDAQEEE